MAVRYPGQARQIRHEVTPYGFFFYSKPDTVPPYRRSLFEDLCRDPENFQDWNPDSESGLESGYWIRIQNPDTESGFRIRILNPDSLLVGTCSKEREVRIRIQPVLNSFLRPFLDFTPPPHPAPYLNSTEDYLSVCNSRGCGGGGVYQHKKIKSRGEGCRYIVAPTPNLYREHNRPPPTTHGAGAHLNIHPPHPTPKQ